MDDQMKNISGILEKWETLQPSIEEFFRARNQTDAKKVMEKGIQLFIQFLLLSNDRSSNTDLPVPYNELSYKPVNLEERLEFIIARPNLFHSYRQLSELILEQKKQVAKKNIQIKTSRS